MMGNLFQLLNGLNPKMSFPDNGVQIRQINQKYGLVDSHEHTLLPHEYDNIFKAGINTYALNKNGKFGVISVDDNKLNWIAPCEYDVINSPYGWDLVLTNKEEHLYYFETTKHVRYFEKIDIIRNIDNDTYVFATDKLMYYIILPHDEKVLWSCEKNNDLLFPCGEPCFMFLGVKNDLPLLFDCTNSNYIYPTKDGKLSISQTFPYIMKSIILNGQNTLNIIEYKDGIEIDSLNDYPYASYKLNEADSITLEFKVTLERKDSYEERIYSIPNGVFHKGNKGFPFLLGDT